MLATFVLYLAWIVLEIIHGVLSIIPFSLPAQVQTSINFFAGYLAYANGIIDIPGTLAALQFLLDFMLAWFAFKVAMLIFHWVGTRSAHHSQALPGQAKTTKR